MTVCPDCLREEFSFAPASKEKREETAIKQGNELSFRRASARAERLSGGMQSGSAFGPHGSLRFVLGVVIFLICALIFMYGSKLEAWELRTFLPAAAQRPVSMLLCWVAAALVFSSSRVNKWLVYPVVIFFVIAGWFMPDFWSAASAREKKDTAVAIAASGADSGETPESSERASSRTTRELTEEDLAIFREKKQEAGNAVNYGIYISTRDGGLRQSIRGTIARLLEAESCVAYTRGQGTLFIVSRAAGGTRNIGRIAARFGDLNYANPAEGLYEVAFRPDKVYAVSRFASEVLSTPEDASFVQANLAELRNLLDPHRVCTAASALAAANVQSQRDEIRTALGAVLRDPWATEPEAYAALVQALVVYAAPGDKVAVDACRKYFISCRQAKRVPSVAVMELLIREIPDEMVSPVVELWCANPVEWGNMLGLLGTRTQDVLLEVLESTDSLQLIGSILKHLEHNGTPEAIPAVKRYVDHHDSLISRTARVTLRALGGESR